jgi:hypothetical protein
MHADLELALRRLGYRLLGPDVWAKPVAYVLLVVRHRPDGVAEFSTHFKGVDDKLYVWDRQEITDTPESGGYTHCLKYAESAVRLDVGTQSNADFGFLTPAELYTLL